LALYIFSSRAEMYSDLSDEILTSSEFNLHPGQRVANLIPKNAVCNVVVLQVEHF